MAKFLATDYTDKCGIAPAPHAAFNPHFVRLTPQIPNNISDARLVLSLLRLHVVKDARWKVSAQMKHR